MHRSMSSHFIRCHRRFLSSQVDKLNAVTTLPAPLASRSTIFQQIKAAHATSPILAARQWFGFAKSILLFYKSGLKGVWANHKLKRQILNHHYVDGVNGKSNITKGKDLVKYLYDELYILKIGEKKGKSSQVTLSRSEYQLVLRTERDFVKLPVFALLFVAFEELTPLVCLLFPLLIPSTCVTPAAVRKLYHKRDEKIGGVKLLLGPYFQGKVREMSEEEAGRLYDFFKLGWMGKISSSNAIEKLEFYRKEILVDTQLILNNGGFELLNKQELLRSVYERGLKSGAEEKKTEEKNIEESIDEKCEARFVEKLNKWAKDTDFEI